MERTKIAQIFADQEQFGGKEVLVSGWARTIRDMKTFGFVELNDGSCFKNLQIVLDANALDNYRGDRRAERGRGPVRHRHRGTHHGGQAAPGGEGRLRGGGGPLCPRVPLQKKRHSVEYLRTIAHLRPRTNLFSAAFRVRSVAAHAIHCFFQDRGFVYVHTPIITASDCEGRRDVPGDHPGPGEPAPHRGRQGGLQPGLLRQARQPDRLRPAQRRELRHGLRRRIHLRPHLPGGEFQHPAPRRRVLDDRAGDGLLRPQGRHGRGRGHDQAHHPHRHGEVPRRDQLLQLLRGQGPQGAAGACGLLRLRPGELHRGGGAAQTEQRQVRLQGGVGHRPPDRA